MKISTSYKLPLVGEIEKKGLEVNEIYYKTDIEVRANEYEGLLEWDGTMNHGLYADLMMEQKYAPFYVRISYNGEEYSRTG